MARGEGGMGGGCPYLTNIEGAVKWFDAERIMPVVPGCRIAPAIADPQHDVGQLCFIPPQADAGILSLIMQNDGGTAIDQLQQFLGLHGERQMSEIKAAVLAGNF